MKVYDGSTTDTADAAEPERVKVGIAEYKIASENSVLTTSGLGSCLGVALYDYKVETAGLVHVMLPSAEEMDDSNEAKFADTGIRALVDELERGGADANRMKAKIAGGSDMLDFSEDGSGIGLRNVEMGKETLDELGIPVIGEDVGGEHGRSIRLEVDTGDLVVKSANKESITL